MRRVAALPPAAMLMVVLAAALSACGASDEPPAPPVGEAQTLERAEAMLQERAPEPAASEPAQ